MNKLSKELNQRAYWVTWNVGGVSDTVPVDARTLYMAVGVRVKMAGMVVIEIVPELDFLINGASMIALDLEASHTRGFVHRPLELQSLAFENPIS
nr:hypothetical protein [Tanacetum cinerariifolium]